MTVFMEGHIPNYLMTAESDITLPVGKVHYSTAFLTEVLKETAS